MKKKKKIKIKKIPLFKHKKTAILASLLFIALLITLFIFRSYAALYSWPFSNPADYTYDSSKIEVSGGLAILKDLSGFDHTDDDNSATGFGGGTMSDVQWDSGNSWLEFDATGQTNGSAYFESRILDAGQNITWDTISWETQRPIGKPLPDNEGTEIAYGEGNIDMTDNAILLHMDESSGTIIDSSGNGNNGTNNGATYGATGIFDKALSFNGTDNYVDLGSSQIADTFTWVGWVKPGDLSTITMFFSDFDTIGVHDRLSMKTRNTGVFQIQSQDQYGTYQRATSTTTLSEDTWYHVAAVRTGGDNLSLYINGSLDVFDGTVVDDVLYPTVGNATLGRSGSYNHASLYWEGDMDEVAIFNRALSPTEISDIYKRGVIRLKYHVRSCNDVACSGKSFIGPDGTSGSYYNELTNDSINLPSLTLTNIADNRYFQYKAFLESDTASYSPELKSVDISPKTYYSNSNPTISNNTAITYNNLSGFSETLGGGNSGSIEYQISNNGSTWYYWNGSAWTTETGSGYPLQTNTDIEIDSNIASLPDGDFYFKAFLVSDGSQPVEIDSINLDYSNTVLPPSLSFSGDPLSILEGASSTLTWSAPTADSCTASGGWSGSVGVSGTQVISPASSTTYSLECSNTGGSSGVLDVSITVTPIPSPSGTPPPSYSPTTKPPEDNGTEDGDIIENIDDTITEPEEQDGVYKIDSREIMKKIILEQIAKDRGFDLAILKELNKNTEFDPTKTEWKFFYKEPEGSQEPQEPTEIVFYEQPAKYYTVQPGDFLALIAQKVYGSTSRWPEIVELNKNAYPSISDSPYIISVGWNLKY